VPLRQTQHLGGHAVGLDDGAAHLQRQVAHRRALVQLRVAVARGFELGLRLAQLLVLHLELDLVHRNFVHQALLLRRRGISGWRQIAGQAALRRTVQLVDRLRHVRRTARVRTHALAHRRTRLLCGCAGSAAVQVRP
jgi:hypothetical protein